MEYVICTDNLGISQLITVGKKYQVVLYSFKTNLNSIEYIRIINDNGDEVNLSSGRFKRISEIRNDKINKLLYE